MVFVEIYHYLCNLDYIDNATEIDDTFDYKRRRRNEIEILGVGNSIDCVLPADGIMRKRG